MYSLFFLGLTSVLASLVLTPAVGRLALRFGLVDQPDKQRKIHVFPIPRFGGLAIMISVAAAYGAYLFTQLSGKSILIHAQESIVHAIPAILLVFLTGFVDDFRGLSPSVKISIEFIAAVWAWFSGIQVVSFDGHSFGWVGSLLCTIIWLLACTNALNLIDGIDGLAGGVGLLALASMLLAAEVSHNLPMAIALVPIAGATVGFLRYNFNPASIFLGDSGSLSLGFLIGCFGAVWSAKFSTVLGLSAPLLLMGIPLLDAALAIVRRFLRGTPLFTADREHIHHKLLALGLNQRKVVLILYGVCILGAIVSLSLRYFDESNKLFIFIVIALAVLLGIQQLYYREFETISKAFYRTSFRHLLGASFALDELESAFHRGMSDEEIWKVVCANCERFGFSGARLESHSLIQSWGEMDGWRVSLDMPESGCVYLWRMQNTRGSSASAVLFADFLARAMKRVSEREKREVCN